MSDSKTEHQVFSDEVRPFLGELRTKINPIFVLHLLWNYAYLSALVNERDRNLSTAPPNTRGPAIVTASGPSLDAVIPYLNKIRAKHKAKIFCGQTQLWALHYQGVRPDYVLQQDPWPRRCIACKTGHVYFDDKGSCWCRSCGYLHSDEERSDIIRRTTIHRWAPEVDATVLAHPAVQRETLQWASFKRSGKLFILDFNPRIGPFETRKILRGQHIGRAMEEFLAHLQDAELDDHVKALVTALVDTPSVYERQDIPADVAVHYYGGINPGIRYPLKTLIPYGPSTPIQAAIAAYVMGHGPIYFAGYDLCEWQHRVRAQAWYYDGTCDAPILSKPNPERLGEAAPFAVDYIKVGEKWALAHYASKIYHGHYAFPGMRLVEIVAENTPGNLEVFPRIRVEQLAKGHVKEVEQEKTAHQIRAILTERKRSMNPA